MTNAEAKTLKYGDKVFYHDIAAIVQRATASGVMVSFDGRGPKAGQYITERVAARYLTRRA